MVDSSTSNAHPAPQLEASMSKLSIESSVSEDWDRSASDIRIDQDLPKTPSTARISSGHELDNDGTPSGTGGRRSLSDLLRLHAEKGKDLQLSEEDEQRLSEELGRWINSDSSPYEPDDDFFSRPSKDDSSLPTVRCNKPVEGNTRPRGQSESILPQNISAGRSGNTVAGATS